MDGFGLLAGLLGGYQQGRQLRQTRDIRKAQIDRQVVQDAYTRAHQQKMEDYAARRLKLAENPVRNLDPAAGVNFDRAKNDIDKYWTDWRTRMAKQGVPIAEKMRTFEEGLSALPGHRRQLQSNIDQWGSQIGYENADPDMFLGPMHGIQGVKYNAATGSYQYYDPQTNEYKFNPKAFESQFAGTSIDPADKASIEALKKYVEGTDLTPEARRSMLAAKKKETALKYGQAAADVEFAYLPGDPVQIGETQDFVPTPGGFKAFTPNEGFKLPGNVNPALGIESPTEQVRRVVDPTRLQSFFGADAPGQFATPQERQAYNDARYKPYTQKNPLFYPKPTSQSFNPLQGQFNIAPMFQLGLRQPEFTDPDKEFRRSFMQRVMTPGFVSTNQGTDEERGLSLLIEGFKQTNPDFNPFANPEDARKILQIAPPNIAPMFHQAVSKIASEGGYERQTGEVKTVPVMGKYDIKPLQSTVTAKETANLASAKTTETKSLLPGKLNLQGAELQEYKNKQNERMWRRGFEWTKFKAQNALGWTNANTSRMNTNLSAERLAFDKRVNARKTTIEDIKTVQSMYKHADGEVSTLKSLLSTYSREKQSYDALYTTNAGTLSRAGLSNLDIERLRKGELNPSMGEYNEKIVGNANITAANILAHTGRLDRKITDTAAKLQLAQDDLDEAKVWEGKVRASLTGKNQAQIKMYDAWKKSDPTLTDDIIWGYVSLDQSPQEKEPSGGAKSGKPKPTIGKDFSFSNRK
jgi:hypothetical protein